ncbi:MAG: twin-arginine translocase TatA/TatE family subunit [Alphaproteobacteria bacterium]
MGFSSWWHWVVVAIVVLVLFGGGGKIPRLMGDLAKGIRSFKTGLKPEEVGEAEEPEEPEPAPRVTAEAPKKRAASSRSKPAAKSGAARRKTAKS